MTKFEKKIDNILYSLLTTPNIPTGTIVIKKREEVRQAVRELVPAKQFVPNNNHVFGGTDEIQALAYHISEARSAVIDETLKAIGE